MYNVETVSSNKNSDYSICNGYILFDYFIACLDDDLFYPYIISSLYLKTVLYQYSSLNFCLVEKPWTILSPPRLTIFFRELLKELIILVTLGKNHFNLVIVAGYSDNDKIQLIK